MSLVDQGSREARKRALAWAVPRDRLSCPWQRVAEEVLWTAAFQGCICLIFRAFIPRLAKEKIKNRAKKTLCVLFCCLVTLVPLLG